MARINVSITDEFNDLVKDYARCRDITTSAALAELAGLGFMQQTGQKPVSVLRTHGGPKARQVVPLPELAYPQPKASVTHESDPVLARRTRAHKGKVADELRPSVTLDDTAARADDMMRTFQFVYSEDQRGVLEWNVYTKSYRQNRLALGRLLKLGYIELINKEKKQIRYKITPKGLNYKVPPLQQRKG